MLNNANNVDQSGSSCSWHQISRVTSCGTELNHGTPQKHSKYQQTSCSGSQPKQNNASVQVTPNETTSHLLNQTLSGPHNQKSLLKSRGVVVEGLIVRTEDEDDGESDKTRSIHLIPFVMPAPSRRPVVVNKICVSSFYRKTLFHLIISKK